MEAIGRALDRLLLRYAQQSRGRSVAGRAGVDPSNPDDDVPLKPRAWPLVSQLSSRIRALVVRVHRETPRDVAWRGIDEAQARIDASPTWTIGSLRALREQLAIVHEIATRPGFFDEVRSRGFAIPQPPKKIGRTRFTVPELLTFLAPALQGERRTERRQAAIVLANMLESHGFANEADALRLDAYSDRTIAWVGLALGYRSVR